MKCVRLNLWILLLLAVSLFRPAPSAATPVPECSCSSFPTLAQALDASNAVFKGLILSTRSAEPVHSRKVWATIRVTACWKGSLGETVDILTPENEGLCGMEFAAGYEYLVFASSGPSFGLGTDLCDRSHYAPEGDADVIALGSPKPAAVTRVSWGAVKSLFRN